MDKTVKNYNFLVKRYKKYSTRVNKIEEGNAESIGRTKNLEWLKSRLSKLLPKLRKINYSILIASGILLTVGTAQAQVFTEQTGVNNPLNGEDVGSYGVAEFGDIDGDGDSDLLVGETGGSLSYFRNTGTASSPNFVEQTGASNPFDGINPGNDTSPALADTDDDGDLDLYLGMRDGTFAYYENTGSTTTPTFVQRTGASNPLDGVDIGWYSALAFTDLDDDGDLDMLGGEYYGVFYYYENTGSVSSPNYTQRTGGANPMNGQDAGWYSSPVFIDIDNDGDLDVISGENNGGFTYYENTGSTTTPAYTERTGAANPLDAFDAGSLSTPAEVDIDGDGDMDIMSSNASGQFSLYSGAGTGGPLPIELLSFTATSFPNAVQLAWETATEINNDYFIIERSKDGSAWESILTENGAGNSTRKINYSVNDQSPILGTSYYRLTQIDFDGSSETFEIKAVTYESKEAVQLYPNPASSFTNVSLTSGDEVSGKVNIFNIQGQQMNSIPTDFQSGMNQISLDVNDLIAGTYTIQIVANDAVITKRLTIVD